MAKFVVIRDPGKTSNHHPTYLHENKYNAEKEAMRLAEKDLGADFFVCRVISKAGIPKPSATITKVS